MMSARVLGTSARLLASCGRLLNRNRRPSPAATRRLPVSPLLRALDSDDLLRIVQLWDPLKQRTAAQSMVYYVKHVEKNGPLGKRLDAFLAKQTPKRRS
jgi:hypothetical protein